jgi:membrane-associated phospholipid phosphatase
MFQARNLLSRFPEVAFIALLISVIPLFAAGSNIVFLKFEILLVPVFVLTAIWLWYDWRGIARLSELAYYPMMLFVSGISGLVLSYLVVDPTLPAYDGALAKMDAALFFHWPDWLTFYRSHPWCQRVLKLTYDSWGVQLYGSAFFFALTGQQSRNRELLRIAIVSSVLTLAVFHSFPALGPFFYFSVGQGIESLLHMPHLRAGERLTLTPIDLQGLISFPSFHTVMALAFMYVHRGQGRLTHIVVMVNAAMLLATIMCGAHYLSDLLGGAVITATAIAVIRLMNANGLRRRAQVIDQPASPA